MTPLREWKDGVKKKKKKEQLQNFYDHRARIRVWKTKKKGRHFKAAGKNKLVKLLKEEETKSHAEGKLLFGVSCFLRK